MLEVVKPETKAWNYFKKLLNDDEKFHKLKNLNEPIEITGSEGGLYYMYPSGQIASIDKNGPKIGNVTITDEMAGPDFMSAVLFHILNDEHKFKKVWGCGNLRVFYGKEPTRQIPVYNAYHVGGPLTNRLIDDNIICGTMDNIHFIQLSGSVGSWSGT